MGFRIKNNNWDKLTKQFVMDELGKLITENQTIIASLGVAGNISAIIH